MSAVDSPLAAFMLVRSANSAKHGGWVRFTLLDVVPDGFVSWCTRQPDVAAVEGPAWHRQPNKVMVMFKELRNEAAMRQRIARMINTASVELACTFHVTDLGMAPQSEERGFADSVIPTHPVTQHVLRTGWWWVGWKGTVLFTLYGMCRTLVINPIRARLTALRLRRRR